MVSLEDNLYCSFTGSLYTVTQSILREISSTRKREGCVEGVVDFSEYVQRHYDAEQKVFSRSMRTREGRNFSRWITFGDSVELVQELVAAKFPKAGFVQRKVPRPGIPEVYRNISLEHRDEINRYALDEVERLSAFPIPSVIVGSLSSGEFFATRFLRQRVPMKDIVPLALFFTPKHV